MTLHRVLELRLGGAQAAAKRPKTLLARAGKDDRIRGSLQYHGAGPGRWSGRGFQPQNLKRITTTPEETESAIAAVMRGSLQHLKQKYPRPLSVLGDISRPMIVAAPGHLLLGGDYSAIESRALAWVSGEEWKITAYKKYDATGAKSDEPYIRIASTISGIPPGKITPAWRKIGKTTDLACGYQGGPAAYRAFSDEGTDEEVEQLIDGWRASHPATVKLWRLIDRAAVMAVQNRDRIVHCNSHISFISTGAYLFMVLPSGRRIAYPSPELIKDQYGRLRVSFLDNANGQFKPCRNGLGAYGGLWTENAVQGLCRDLLAAALVRLDAAGFRIVLHVHDEVLVETAADLDDNRKQQFSRLLIARPRWALGLPIAAEVWSGPRYLKS